MLTHVESPQRLAQFCESISHSQRIFALVHLSSDWIATPPSDARSPVIEGEASSPVMIPIYSPLLSAPPSRLGWSAAIMMVGCQCESPRD